MFRTGQNGSPSPAQKSGSLNNTCYLTTNENYIKMPGDCSSTTRRRRGVRVGGNRSFFAPGKNATVGAVPRTVSIQQWFKDVGDFDSRLPTVRRRHIDEIVKHGLKLSWVE